MSALLFEQVGIRADWTESRVHVEISEDDGKVWTSHRRMERDVRPGSRPALLLVHQVCSFSRICDFCEAYFNFHLILQTFTLFLCINSFLKSVLTLPCYKVRSRYPYQRGSRYPYCTDTFCTLNESRKGGPGNRTSPETETPVYFNFIYKKSMRQNFIWNKLYFKVMYTVWFVIGPDWIFLLVQKNGPITDYILNSSLAR